VPTGRKLRPVQRFCLGAGQPEQKIFGKPLAIALDLLVKTLGRNAIERCKLGVQQNPLPTQYENSVSDVLDGRERCAVRWLHRTKFQRLRARSKRALSAQLHKYAALSFLSEHQDEAVGLA
jgi:hypothetical protein